MKREFPIDLLRLLYEKEISEDEAYKLESQGLVLLKNSTMQDIYNQFKIDNYEWTAIAGYGLMSEVSKWRYEGWPERCPLCKRRIIKEKFGWMHKPKYPHFSIVHISCDESYLKQIGYTEEEIADKK